MTRARTLALTLFLALGLTAALASQSVAAGNRSTDGLYAPKASGNLPYSNGAVNLEVASGGGKIVFPSGVACYTGSTPPVGVPSYDEVSIHIPRTLTIAVGGSFSFSGPVTLSAEEARSEAPIQTTYTIKGRFRKGRDGAYEAIGTDSSPICQPSTQKSFTLPFVPGER
ncbi:MAG: hypothetical protein JSS68_06700 [Actinobacteria bacterium]|nr:hypothetical protein [Actinomycetota bacterium]